MNSLKNLLLITTSCMVLTGLTNSAFAAKFYKWVDEEGVTHYTERQPQDKSTTEIKTYGPSSTVKSTSRLIDKEPEPQKAVEEIAPQQTAPQSVKLSKKDCDTLRFSLSQLNQGKRTRVKGKDGEYRYISEEEQQQKIEDLTNRLQEEC